MSVEIHYCVKCQWMLRSAWLQQEILSTFTKEEGVIERVSLCPSWTPGTFIVKVNNTIVWDRRVDGGFPQAKELKQKIRDQLQPSRDLGHNERSHDHDKHKHKLNQQIPSPVPDLAASQTPDESRGDLGSPTLNAKGHTFCEECVEGLPPQWEL